MNKPDWVQQGVLATCDRTIFSIHRLRQLHETKELVLAAANGDTYPADRCRKASLRDIPVANTFVDEWGTRCKLQFSQGLVTLRVGSKAGGVKLKELDHAALVIAAVFDGKIIEEEGIDG